MSDSEQKAMQDKKDRFRKKRIIKKKREQRVKELAAQNAKD